MGAGVGTGAGSGVGEAVGVGVAVGVGSSVCAGTAVGAGEAVGAGVGIPPKALIGSTNMTYAKRSPTSKSAASTVTRAIFNMVFTREAGFFAFLFSIATVYHKCAGSEDGKEKQSGRKTGAAHGGPHPQDALRFVLRWFRIRVAGGAITAQQQNGAPKEKGKPGNDQRQKPTVPHLQPSIRPRKTERGGDAKRAQKHGQDQAAHKPCPCKAKGQFL